MSSEHDHSQPKTFQVVDKRRFDSSGQERSSETITTTHTVTSSGSGIGEGTGAHQPDTTSGPQQVATNSGQFTLQEPPAVDEAESVAFTSFIMSLATQVLVQLGEMHPPDGMSIPVDLESARQTIDIMAMLQRRTRGNLSGDEARLMEEVLHSLRVSFINAKKRVDS